MQTTVQRILTVYGRLTGCGLKMFLRHVSECCQFVGVLCPDYLTRCRKQCFALAGLKISLGHAESCAKEIQDLLFISDVAIGKDVVTGRIR